MSVALPIEQYDSWEVARTKINNSFNNLSNQFINSIPYIQDGFWYVNGENTGVKVTNGNLSLRVNDWILQWKNSDSTMQWQNLLKLSDLKWDPWESWKIYWADIVDCTTELDEDRGITYLVIWLDDWTSRRVELFKWNDLYKYPTKQIEQAIWNGGNGRNFFVKVTDPADAEIKIWVLVNPDTMDASGEVYEPEYWDRLMVYFANGCKADNPKLNIDQLGNFPIQLKNLVHSQETYANHTYYYRFHIGAWTWIQMVYMWNKYITNDENDVVDIYEWETWNLINAIRELKRTRKDVTEEELLEIKARGEYDPNVYYYIKD